MFSSPKYGWTKIMLDDVVLGNASYLSGAIIPTLEACYRYLAEGSSSFNLIFDQEGSSFGIVKIDTDFYFWTDNTHNGEVSLIHCFEDEWIDDYSFVKKIAKETIKDVKENLSNWADFEGVFDENTTEEEKREVENEIKEWIEKVENVLNVREMELGNLLFGHSCGEYPIEREDFEDRFVNFLTGNGFDSYGYVTDENLEVRFGQIKESEQTNADIYPEGYNPELGSPDYHPHLHYFDNGIFMVNPYYWGDADDLCVMPNFIYYPENIKIRWYKYPLRDAYSNTELSKEKLDEILTKCEESLKVLQ